MNGSIKRKDLIFFFLIKIEKCQLPIHFSYNIPRNGSIYCLVIDPAVGFDDVPKDSDVNVTHEGTENIGGKDHMSIRRKYKSTIHKNDSNECIDFVRDTFKPRGSVLFVITRLNNAQGKKKVSLT